MKLHLSLTYHTNFLNYCSLSLILSSQQKIITMHLTKLASEVPGKLNLKLLNFFMTSASANQYIQLFHVDLGSL